MTEKSILLKNHTQNVLEKLFPDTFLKNQNWAYLSINNSLKFYKVRFYSMLTWEIHIFPNISRRKGNLAMKFGQLIEYNMKKNFVEKSYRKCAGETIPRSLSKIWKLSISLDQYFKVCFYCMLIWGLPKYSEIKLQYLILNFFKKQKAVRN